MSYYTYIKPDWKITKTIDELNLEQQKLENQINLQWAKISSLCSYNPTSLDDMHKVREEQLESLDEFERLVEERRLVYYQSVSIEDELGEIYWNHFEHSNLPEEGIDEDNKFIQGVRNKLVMMASGKLLEYARTVSEQKDDDGEYSVLEWLTSELNQTKEWYLECLYERLFCKLMIQYADTITRG